MIDFISDEEREIVDYYLNQKKSIREICAIYKCGRTKINNALEKYAAQNEENATQIKLQKASFKSHRKIDSIDEANKIPLSEEEIENAYRRITENGETLRDVSSDMKRNRETLKRAIIEFLGDDKEAIVEFKAILKDNQNPDHARRALQYCETEDDKKQIIFSRLNYRRALLGKNQYPLSMLERKYQRLVDYFEKRNLRILEPEGQISKEDLLKMMYDSPTLLSMSLSDKINPIIKKLDYNYLGTFDTSRVLKANPAILGTSIQRTRLQIKILKETETLKYALEKPRIFRTSPEFLYSLIKFWEYREKQGKPFITKNRLSYTYGLSPQDLQGQFNIREEYGDDEYFDGR